ncbi:uncharacterized protein LDX57_012098 [Aspergillus melleus]|uniref:uncharacterized protein n=1 Tax=Aspergillus melleus TaxID=138277 RepID=UPI001E8DFB21|nr:uncharacterized protein LDX57_012098 [Aspergillus melleus]KAH8434451.1 hypothetical protein LDX57_012098 [Aspergillus melleus]
MDEIVRLVKAMGRQQCLNAYYRVCYLLLKDLQERIQSDSDDLLKLCFDESTGPGDLEQAAIIAIGLRDTVAALRAKERRARIDREEFY